MLIDEHKIEFDRSLEFLKKELSALRTGRANAALIEDIMVDAYGVKTPIKQLANISIPDARTMVIDPWDKNIMKDVEKGIVLANIGYNPVNEGKIIRISLPSMTEENRKDMIKVLGQKIEQGRINIRQLRDKVKELIGEQEQAKEITEDDRYNLLKKLDEVVDDYNIKIKKMAEDKEKEIMTV